MSMVPSIDVFSREYIEIHKARTLKLYCFYFIMIVVIGFPLWWYNTSPYRAQLVVFPPMDYGNMEGFFGNLFPSDLYESPRVNSMVNRVKEMSEVDITNTPNVWDDVSISAAYSVHLVFVHEDNTDRDWAAPIEAKIIAQVNRMVNYLSDSLFFSVSSEHLWELFQAKIFKKTANGTYTGSRAELNTFISEIDQRSSPMILPDPLFKLVFVLSKTGLQIEGIQGKDHVFASWGSIIDITPTSEKVRSSIVESFQSLLGACSQSPGSVDECAKGGRHPNPDTWQRFRQYAFLENVLKTIHYTKAINNLASTMPQLVITNEVSRMVQDAKRLVEEAISEKKAIKAAAARLLAERAADHSSLIGTSDLTPFLKLGIYVPIVMPLVHPIFDVIFVWLLHAFKVWRKGGKTKAE